MGFGPRVAQDIELADKLVVLVRPRKQGTECGNLSRHGAKGPNVNGARIDASSEQQLWGTVPAGRDVGRKWVGAVCVSCQTKVCELDNIRASLSGVICSVFRSRQLKRVD